VHLLVISVLVLTIFYALRSTKYIRDSQFSSHVGQLMLDICFTVYIQGVECFRVCSKFVICKILLIMFV
jgi:hypothetical protein